MASNIPTRVVTAGLLTGVTDGLFSTVLAIAFYHSSFARLFKGVASVLLGPNALNGGSEMVALGVMMHFGVAFAWSILFASVIMRAPWTSRVLGTPYGAARAAAIYGPLIWMTMSLLVIPILAHRPPSITSRWWTQLIGHIPFVAYPIVKLISSPSDSRA